MQPLILKLRAPQKKLTKEQELADQIFKEFKTIPFPRIMKLIQTKGYQFCFEAWNEVRKGNAKNPPALFLWKMKQTQVIFKEI